MPEATKALPFAPLLCAISLALASPAPLRAQTQGQATEGGSPASATLTAIVRASVAATCGFSPGAAPSGNIAVGNIEKAYSAEILFSLRCNGPMRVAIVSDNGGLLAGNVPAVPSGYANLAPYQVTLALAGNPGVASVQASCSSKDLVAGASACPFRGPAAPGAGLLLAGPSTDAAGSFLRVSSPGFVGSLILAASSVYSDRLTVTFSPAT